MTQAPLEHCVPAPHEPHDPPQPSSPQIFPSHDGVQQLPPLVQLPELQVPQNPPQPSPPHSLPVQSGWQRATHDPVLHSDVESQLPHEPPQPSSPQEAPRQEGTQLEPVVVPLVPLVEWVQASSSGSAWLGPVQR